MSEAQKYFFFLSYALLGTVSSVSSFLLPSFFLFLNSKCRCDGASSSENSTLTVIKM